MAMMSEAAADAAKDRADELAYQQDAELERMAGSMWSLLQNAGDFDAADALGALATLKGEKIAQDRRQLVRLACTGSQINDAHCRGVFGLLQNLMRQVADQWAREELGQ